MKKTVHRSIYYRISKACQQVTRNKIASEDRNFMAIVLCIKELTEDLYQ